MVYTSTTGDMWITEGAGPPRRLTSGHSPQPSRDGRLILFRRDLPPSPAGLPRNELRVIATDGSWERRLAGPEDLPGERGKPPESDTEVTLDRLPLQAEWLPDNRTVAFNTRTVWGYGWDSNCDLWLVDLEADALTQILPDGEGGGAFAFSPDGSHLVVGTHDEVAMMDADGTNRRSLVTFEPVHTHSEWVYYPTPIWASDGSCALIAIPSQDPLAPDAADDLWRLPLSGDAVLVGNTSGEAIITAGLPGGLSWSPDRAQLAYTVPAAEGAFNNRNLVLAKGDGSNPVVYATGGAEFKSWNPDCRRFAFWQNEPQGLYLGQFGQPAARLALPKEIRRVRLLLWVDEETFVYEADHSKTERVIWLGQVDGPHHPIAPTDSIWAIVAPPGGSPE